MSDTKRVQVLNAIDELEVNTASFFFGQTVALNYVVK